MVPHMNLSGKLRLFHFAIGIVIIDCVTVIIVVIPIVQYSIDSLMISLSFFVFARDRLRSHSLENAGKLQITPEQVTEIFLHGICLVVC